VKPAPFVYHAPETLDEALAVLADVGQDGKVLAGGQSLVPLLSMRLASPAHVIDINKITELGFVHADAAAVRVGALARHAAVERHAAAARAQPLLRQALQHVAHPVIRNRGTTVGSIVHADPAGEMPAVLALLGGEVEVASRSGRRVIAAADLFLGPLESSLRPDELAVEARFPVAGAGERSAFVELARRHGDYAVCGVAVVINRVAGRLVAARAGYLSVAGTPVLLDLLEALTGTSAGTPDGRPDGTPDGTPDWTPDWAGVDAYVQAHLDPDGDIHATAAYRRHLAGALTTRALRAALQPALGEAPDQAVA